MKKTLLISIIIIQAFICNAQINLSNWHSQPTCSESDPTYYTIKKVNIYEEMSLESAISMDIASGEALKVTNSFFGENGWWEICYKGKSGWVRKSNLSRRAPTQKVESYSEPKESTDYSSDVIQTIDVGFSPFMGKTKTAVNFRTSPSVDGKIIRKLSLGTSIYVFSEKAFNGFYKIIDIKTGIIGWVSEKLVGWESEAKINYSGAFQSTGKTSSFNSEVTIRNKSSYKITLVVGSNTYFLAPNSTDYKTISPGSSYYIATAPGVIPSSGYQTFNSNEKYEWEFWVETRSR